MGAGVKIRRLMHNLFCDRLEDMHYKILADRMQAHGLA